MTRYLAIIIALVVSMLSACNPIPAAHAQSSGGSAGSFQHSATTTVTRVGGSMPTGTRYAEIRCWVNSATVVRFGSCDDLDATHGYPLCTDTASCETDALTWRTRNLCALSSSGDVTLECTTIR